MEKYKSRKFGFAVFFSAVGALALFTNSISGDQFVLLATVVLGLYGAANVGEKYVSDKAG